MIVIIARNIQVSQQKKNICDDKLHSSQSCWTPVINQKKNSGSNITASYP